ncbi:MAG: hypothetical protein AAGK21_04115 [Bacteroidota bacterium]
MDKSEFERIKAEEKAHLRKLRALKQQHRDAKRKASTLSALNSMRNQALEDETSAMTDKLMRDAALSEARFELATEGDAPVTGNAEELDREALAKAEAEALVRQMKAQMGGGGDVSATEAAQNAGSPSVPDSAKTIGRTPPPAEEPPPPANDAKTIGRQRGQ